MHFFLIRPACGSFAIAITGHPRDMASSVPSLSKRGRWPYVNLCPRENFRLGSQRRYIERKGGDSPSSLETPGNSRMAGQQGWGASLEMHGADDSIYSLRPAAWLGRGCSSPVSHQLTRDDTSHAWLRGSWVYQFTAVWGRKLEAESQHLACFLCGEIRNWHPG